MTQIAPEKRTGSRRAARPTEDGRTAGTTDTTTTEGRERPAAEQPTEKPRAAPPSSEPEPEAAEAVMGLDMVLVDGARGPLRRLVPPARTTLRFARSLAGKPDVVARRSGELAKELGRVVAGRSEVAPHKKDKRFTDPAWSGNPLLRRVMQAHIATAQTAAQ